jgi:hypothetical protein
VPQREVAVITRQSPSNRRRTGRAAGEIIENLTNLQDLTRMKTTPSSREGAYWWCRWFGCRTPLTVSRCDRQAAHLSYARFAEQVHRAAAE